MIRCSPGCPKCAAEYLDDALRREEILAALEKIANGTPNGTSAGTDSDNQKNPGSKPESEK